ncbi:hypothetical protein FACS1894179_01360 [Bacteroidia bacterium]|nr:hypothetical protein FACS1894179_01360 [Bacteroidia bacterium]
MNIFFHVATAVGVTATLTDTNRIESGKDSYKTGLLSMFCSCIIHGILDYIPHTYPLSSKLDVAISLIIIIILVWKANKPYRTIVSLAILGSILPDLIDLLPSISAKYTRLSLPVYDKVFPWHWSEYSGSIFGKSDTVSDINHILVLTVICVVCWCRRTDLKQVFLK